jgi:hypothetical protein
MSTAIRLLGRVLAALVALAVAAACGSAPRAAPPPPCLEPLLSEGRAYALDPGLAMAITTAITYDHPEVGPLVAAAADYQAAHPDTGVFEPDVDDADVASLGYVLLVAAVAVEPGPVDLDLLHRYERVARARGMTGVHEVLTYEGNAPVTIWPIPHLVVDQLTAVRRAGLVGASEAIDRARPGCGASDVPG